MKILLLMVLLVGSLTATAQKKSLKTVTLTPKNSVWLVGVVGLNSPKKLAEEITAARKKHKKGPIYLVITSPGGYISDTSELGAAAEAAKPVHILILFANSMASYISQTIGQKVLIYHKGLIQFHEPRTQIYSPVELSTSELKEFCTYRIAAHEDFLRASSSRLNISYEDFLAKIYLDEWIVRADRAKEVNAVDEIVDVKCDKEMRKKKHSYNFGSEEEPHHVELCKLINGEIE